MGLIMLTRVQRALSEAGDMKSTRVVVILALMAALVLTIYAARRYAFYLIVESYARELGRVFNLNAYFISSVIWTIILLCFGLSFLVLSNNRAYRNVGTVVAFVGVVVYFLILGIGYSSAPHLSGRCYTITASGVEYLELYGDEGEIADPRNGRPCFRITAEIVPILKRYEAGERPREIRYDEEWQDFFHRLTGEPVTWYSVTGSDTVVLYNLMGFDPLTGERLLAVTEEIVARWQAQAAAEKQPERVVDPTVFFANGEALIWFHRDGRGELEFFDGPGFDPVTGGSLQKVTPDIVDEYLRRQRRKQAERELRESQRDPKLLVGKDLIFFSPGGAPIVWYYAKGKDEFDFFDAPGHHPTFGRELLAVTPEIVEAYMRRAREREAEAKRRKAEQEEEQRRLEVEKEVAKRCKGRSPRRLGGDVVFFGSKGEPLVWYFRPSRGDIEMFDCDGFHPIYGQRLMPVTPAIASDYQFRRELQDKLEKAKLQREREERLKLEEEQRAALKAGDDCDRLAGNPTDPLRNARIPGMPYRLLALRAEEAMEICDVATKQRPAELRYQYQLARARQTVSRESAYSEMRALANAGYPAAHDNLGWIVFQRGRSNYSRAKTYFEKGARLGDPDSMVSLSRMLVSGEVGPRNIDSAIFWLRKAAEKDHPDARELLERYEEEKRKGERALDIFLNVLGTIVAKR